MTGSSASIEVDGPAAQAISQSLLQNLGIDCDDVEDADIVLKLGGGEGTTLSIDVSGPLSGDVLAEMLGPVEWGEYDVASVSANVDAADGDTQSEEQSDDEDNESEVPMTDGFRPQVTPFVEAVDPAVTEFPGGRPDRLSEHTVPHATAYLLVEYREVLDEDWVTAKQLSDFAGDDLTSKQAHSALSKLFLEKGLVIRRRVPNTQGIEYEYHPTKQVSEEVERLGEYDTDQVGASP